MWITIPLASSISAVLPTGLQFTKIPEELFVECGIILPSSDASYLDTYVDPSLTSEQYNLELNNDMWQKVFDVFKRFRNQKYTYADGLARLNSMLLTTVNRHEELENELVYQYVRNLPTYIPFYLSTQ